LFREKSTAGWLLVAGLFWEKSTAGWWLISRANRLFLWICGSIAVCIVARVIFWAYANTLNISKALNQYNISSSICRGYCFAMWNLISFSFLPNVVYWLSNPFVSHVRGPLVSKVTKVKILRVMFV
jgi:hypothetical protein